MVCIRNKDALTAGDLTPTRVSIGIFIIGMFGISLGFVLVYFWYSWGSFVYQWDIIGVHLSIIAVSLETGVPCCVDKVQYLH